jgi:hypothetical protein
MVEMGVCRDKRDNIFGRNSGAGKTIWQMSRPCVDID